MSTFPTAKMSTQTKIHWMLHDISCWGRESLPEKKKKKKKKKKLQDQLRETGMVPTGSLHDFATGNIIKTSTSPKGM